MKVETKNQMPSLNLDDDEDEELEDDDEASTQPITNQVPEAPEFINLEFPNGMKLVLGSSKFHVYDLANLSLALLKQHLLNNNKKFNGSYLG